VTNSGGSAMSVPSLSASLKEKQKRDYNVQLDIEVRNWVSVFLGEKIDLSPATSFGTIFKDGVLLCQIINKIQPGLIPEPARSPLAFKQMVGPFFLCDLHRVKKKKK